jgi:hypothetical protein
LSGLKNTTAMGAMAALVAVQMTPQVPARIPVRLPHLLIPAPVLRRRKVSSLVEAVPAQVEALPDRGMMRTLPPQ